MLSRLVPKQLRGAAAAHVREWLPSERPIVPILLLAFTSAVLEASVLAVVAAAATTIAEEAPTVRVGGFGHGIEASVGELLVAGAGMSLAYTGLSLLSAFLVTRYGAEILAHARRRIVRGYLDATYERQAVYTQAELHEFVVMRTVRTMQAAMITINGTAAVVQFLVLVVIAIGISPLLATGMFGVTAALVLVLRPLTRRTFRAGTSYMTSHEVVALEIADIVGLRAEIHVFDAKEEFDDRAAHQIAKSSSDMQRTQFITQVSGSVYAGALLLVLIGVLALAQSQGVGDPTSLAAVVLLMLRAGRYARSGQNALQTVAEVLPNVQSLTEVHRSLHSEDPEVPPADVAVDAIQLRDVTYQYPDTDDGIREVSIDLRRGEVIGVNGASGAGKTTFAEVLLGLRSPQRGEITMSSGETVLSGIRPGPGRVAYVTQHPRLFHGSIGENVAFFRDVSVEDLDRSLELAALQPDLARWDAGLDRPVTHGGGDLSGGQRQRVAFARALLTGPDVIVLDEPTAALDPESERVVVATIAALASRSIVVIISHRSSTLDLCDRIVTFDAGRLVDESDSG